MKDVGYIPSGYNGLIEEDYERINVWSSKVLDTFQGLKEVEDVVTSILRKGIGVDDEGTEIIVTFGYKARPSFVEAVHA